MPPSQPTTPDPEVVVIDGLDPALDDDHVRVMREAHRLGCDVPVIYVSPHYREDPHDQR